MATPKSTIGALRPSGNHAKVYSGSSVVLPSLDIEGGSPAIWLETGLSVAEGNCVAERRGGEQPEANDQSVIKTMMNSIRPRCSLGLFGHVISESTRHQFE